MNLISSYKTEFELLKKFIEEEEERKETEKVAKKLANIFTKGKKVLICGNGGSNCDAMHFIEEFTGRFIGISTSGNSPNVIKAVEQAKAQGLITVGLLGKDGGKLKGMCDYEFIIPGKTSDRVQEIHMMILHIIIEGVERIMFPENYVGE